MSRVIDENSIILNTTTSTFNTYKFTVIYADGTGTLCKVNIGDKLLIRAIYNNEYISIEGILNKFDPNIIYIFVDNILYKIDYSNLIYIYNETTIKYNFDITNYNVEEPEITIPDTTTNGSSSVNLSNIGNGVTILSVLASNTFNFRTLKAGDGISISTDGSTINISTTQSVESMTDADVLSFINTYVSN